MITGSQILERQLADETHLRTLRRMVSSGQRMTEMIEQLLDLTRARLAGGLGFARVYKRLDVASLIQRTVEELRVAHPAREIVVEVIGDCETSGDGDRLLQLFSNLVANAIHHGADGSPVVVKVDGSGREIAVRMENRGFIPPDLLPTIFDPFRNRSKASKSHGLGLGLFICQQIAIAHGGCVCVESSEASGMTVFTVTVPRRFNSPKHAMQAGSPKRILIVDDDDNIRDSLREVFEEEGYEATTASNGREALELLSQGTSRPDVVILDLVLPVLDGSKVYQAMQADATLSKIPVIVSTSNPARAPSGVIVVPKPLKLDRLLDVVAEFFWPQADDS
ncbi:MAG TPA: hybrid sensor histidine kinase/response regulator, partial [Polyangiaceae bacterium]